MIPRLSAMTSSISVCLAVAWFTGHYPRIGTQSFFSTGPARRTGSTRASQELSPATDHWRTALSNPGELDAVDYTSITLWSVAMAKIRSAASPLQQREDGSYERYISLADAPHYCFYPGVIHGGLLATILDEAFAEVCSPALTAGLGITYKAPLRPGVTIRVAVWVARAEARKRWVAGRIDSVAEDKRSQRITLTEAQALFILPRPIENQVLVHGAASEREDSASGKTTLGTGTGLGQGCGDYISPRDLLTGDKDRSSSEGQARAHALITPLPISGIEFLGFEGIV